jgi:hypothetical protein
MAAVFDPDLHWQLLYTKPRAEAWAEANLRKQGFAVLMPRARTARGVGLLFPRYVFGGYSHEHEARVLRSTYGIQYVVHCGERPAAVPAALIADLTSRMDEQGIVRMDDAASHPTLFSENERQRVRALVKLAAAGFRIRAA